MANLQHLHCWPFLLIHAFSLPPLAYKRTPRPSLPHHTSSQAFSSFFSFHRDQINYIFLCLPVLSSSKSRRSIPAKADGRSQQEPMVDPNNAEPSPSDPLTRELKAAIDGVFYSSGCLSDDPTLLALWPPPPCKTDGHRLVLPT
jgi:hypothetical protein